ncbi:MAG: peptide deformylase [Bifidobacteriaceae bacterium]|nr:peptide deformylase [Aeriscardovia sp.]MBQ1803825.1 peptide deformylase [Bifidobacteriaceae bacterium]
MAVDESLTKIVEKTVKRAKWRGLSVVEVGDPVLRKTCASYEGQIAPETFGKLIYAMRSCMLSKPGVGLAAPQVGLPLSFAIMEDHVAGARRKGLGVGEELREEGRMERRGDEREFAEFPFLVAINPSYKPLTSKKAYFYEGCLSLPGFQAVVGRYLDIEAEWEDEKGEEHARKLHGWPARIFQHETDHLSGTLYLDKCITRSFASNDNCEKFLLPYSISKTKKELGFSFKMKNDED